MEAGEEPVGPDGAVGQVAEDAVGFAAAEGLLGRRQVDRAEVVDPGQRVAAVERGCAGTSSRRRRAPAGRRPRERRHRGPAAPAPQAEDEHRGRQQEVELGPGGEAGCEADDEQRADVERRPPPTQSLSVRDPRPGVQRNRHRRQQEEDPDDVVARLPRLVRQRRHAQRDRPQRQRPRRHPVRPPDAPARHQAADEPAEVQQRRQDVPPERQHPGRVEHFAVRRVEPGQELRRDEVQVHVSPLWKNPAANGPWYQVESNPVIPVEPVLTPPAKCTSGNPGTRRAQPRCPPGSSAPHLLVGCGRPPLPPVARRGLQAPSPQPTEQVRHRLPTEAPERLRRPDQHRHASARPPRQVRAPPATAAAAAPAAAAPPSQANPTTAHSSTTPSRYRPGRASPLAAAPQQPHDLLELAIRSSLATTR